MSSISPSNTSPPSTPTLDDHDLRTSPNQESHGQTPAEESRFHTPIENHQEPGNDPYQTDWDASPEVLENNETDEGIVVADLLIAQNFINGIKNATLDNGSMDPQSIDQLQNPYPEVLDMSNPNLRQSLDFYLATELASRDTYRKSVVAVQQWNPEHELLSFHGIEQKIADLSGVVPVTHNMCINSCSAFTGPYAALDSCPYCGTSRLNDKSKPRQVFHTIPLGPQLQALWWSLETADALKYWDHRTQEILAEIECDGNISVFTDLYHGKDYLDAILRGDINEDDMVVMLSIDGAQLYQNKQSDCWIWIWVIFDYSPDMHYKKKTVLIGGTIPGPNKPKNGDSYLYPSLHHVAAIQKEGLKIWDAQRDVVFISHIYLALTTADGPGMTYLL